MADSQRKPLSGVLASLLVTAVITAVIYPVKELTEPASAGVLYLLGVLLVASLWGAWMGVATALFSALAFNFFHLPPTGALTIAKEQDGVAFITFLLVAIAVSAIADQARRRTHEAEQRRQEADLSAESARLLLGGTNLEEALPTVTHRLASVLGLPSATIELGSATPGRRQIGFALQFEDRQIGTLLLPTDISAPTERRVEQRIVPAFQTLLAAALQRDRLVDEVVESQALRRSDEMKTALLRAISHDFRSPLTAIATAGDALGSSSLDQEDRIALSAAVTGEAARLGALVSQLLDLSRLEAGAAEPHSDWCSIEEIVREAIAQMDRDEVFEVAFERGLPLLRADAAQLERAFANLLSNSLRHAEGKPVSVQVRETTGRIVVRVSNQGPGIPVTELERIFEPFYRAGERGTHSGSGLGLAIVKGFVEANGGSVRAESLPGQGATFSVELPIERAPAAAPEYTESAS